MRAGLLNWEIVLFQKKLIVGEKDLSTVYTTFPMDIYCRWRDQPIIPSGFPVPDLLVLDCTDV